MRLRASYSMADRDLETHGARNGDKLTDWLPNIQVPNSLTICLANATKPLLKFEDSLPHSPVAWHLYLFWARSVHSAT
jgi:hypothetical protein